MKRILSERNLAGFLFILVLMAFAFAHEDSKKKDPYYQARRFDQRKPQQVEPISTFTETAPTLVNK